MNKKQYEEEVNKLETAAIYKAAVFEYNSRNKQCKLRKDHSNDS